jgi:glutathione S-transferase
MKGIVDYGDDGIVPMIESDDVETVVETILDYVENRFDLLDKEGGRDADIMALCQEFYEWGSAEAGDEVSYFTCPTFG